MREVLAVAPETAEPKDSSSTFCGLQIGNTKARQADFVKLARDVLIFPAFAMLRGVVESEENLGGGQEVDMQNSRKTFFSP
jgi:hypothetical protein